jgi:hypothetical protein
MSLEVLREGSDVINRVGRGRLSTQLSLTNWGVGLLRSDSGRKQHKDKNYHKIRFQYNANDTPVQ